MAKSQKELITLLYKSGVESLNVFVVVKVSDIIIGKISLASQEKDVIFSHN